MFLLVTIFCAFNIVYYSKRYLELNFQGIFTGPKQGSHSSVIQTVSEYSLQHCRRVVLRGRDLFFHDNINTDLELRVNFGFVQSKRKYSWIPAAPRKLNVTFNRLFCLTWTHATWKPLEQFEGDRKKFSVVHWKVNLLKASSICLYILNSRRA